MTSLRLPDDLISQVRSVVRSDDEAVRRFVEAAVRETLSRRLARSLAEPERRPVQVHPVGAGEVLPDVDLTRWTAFLESQAATSPLPGRRRARAARRA